MNNKISTNFASDFTSLVPKDVMTKYGWVLLATSAICYAIDSIRGFAENVTANGYRVNLKSDVFEFTMERDPAST